MLAEALVKNRETLRNFANNPDVAQHVFEILLGYLHLVMLQAPDAMAKVVVEIHTDAGHCQHSAFISSFLADSIEELVPLSVRQSTKRAN